MRVRIPNLPVALAALLTQVPPGRVTTFGALARALGDRSATVWVASQASAARFDASRNWHRVVKVDGQLGSRDPEVRQLQAEALRGEGVAFVGSFVDLKQHLWHEFTGRAPLEKLRQLQEALRQRQNIGAWRKMPKQLGGVDVSYRGDIAVAAYTLVDVRTQSLVWSITAQRKVTFPYIPGYLTFRELPVLADLLAKVKRAGRLAEVLLVDGAGILHPRRMGIAAHLGTLADWPTVGVAKSLLHGRVVGLHPGQPLEPNRYYPVGTETEQLGWAISQRSDGLMPLYISPGQYVGLDAARKLVERMLTGRRLPEPLYWADRLSREAAAALPRAKPPATGSDA